MYPVPLAGVHKAAATSLDATTQDVGQRSPDVVLLSDNVTGQTSTNRQHPTDYIML